MAGGNYPDIRDHKDTSAPQFARQLPDARKRTRTEDKSRTRLVVKREHGKRR